MLLSKALRLRELIEKLQQTLTDDEQCEGAELLPKWAEDTPYEANFKVSYLGKPYKCLQQHTSIIGWEPLLAPSIWQEILPGQEGTKIGPWEQPDSTNPYKIGDKVLYNEQIWICTINNNVWTPGVYGWEISE